MINISAGDVFSNLFISPILSADLTNSIYQSGKIYVVIIVLAIVLTGLFIYLFRLDNKIKKLDDKFNSYE
jgi:phosphotransferase system  glucose/maltose/N-acetylglucosamine-specific IIC component